MSLVHERLKELIDLLEPLRLRGQLLLDISRPEYVFEVDPVLLARDPLFNDLVECEQVLLPRLGLRAQRLHVSASQDHVYSGEALVKGLEYHIDLIHDERVLVFVLLDNEVNLLPAVLESLHLRAE